MIIMCRDSLYAECVIAVCSAYAYYVANPVLLPIVFVV